MISCPCSIFFSVGLRPPFSTSNCINIIIMSFPSVARRPARRGFLVLLGGLPNLVRLGEAAESEPIYGADGSLHIPPPGAVPGTSATEQSSPDAVEPASARPLLPSSRKQDAEDTDLRRHDGHSLVEKMGVQRKMHERERQRVKDDAWKKDYATFNDNLKDAYHKLVDDGREKTLELWRDAADRLSKQVDDFALPEQNELIRFRDVCRQLLLEFE